MKRAAIALLIFWAAGALALFPRTDRIGQAQEATAIDPFYMKLFEDGKSLYRQGRFQEAVEALKVASFGLIDDRDRLLECYIYLSTGYYKNRAAAAAQDCYGKIVRMNASDKLASLALPKDIQDAYLEMAAAFDRAALRSRPGPIAPVVPIAPPRTGPSEPNEISRLGEAIRKNPRDTEARLSLFYLYLNRKKIKEAKSVLEDWLDVQPSDATALIEMAKIRLDEQKPKDALKYLQKIGRTLERDIEFLYTRGRAFWEAKKTAEAKADFLMVQAREPAYKDTALYLERIARLETPAASADPLALARRETNFKKKVEYYRAALKRNSSNLDIYYELADVYTAQKKWKDAVQVLQAVLKSNPQDKRGTEKLGEIYLMNKDYDKAIALLTSAKEIFGIDMAIRYLLGRAYMGAKKYREAAEEFRTVIIQDPAYRDASRLLSECAAKVK